MCKYIYGEKGWDKRKRKTRKQIEKKISKNVLSERKSKELAHGVIKRFSFKVTLNITQNCSYVVPTTTLQASETFKIINLKRSFHIQIRLKCKSLEEHGGRKPKKTHETSWNWKGNRFFNVKRILFKKCFKKRLGAIHLPPPVPILSLDYTFCGRISSQGERGSWRKQKCKIEKQSL